MVFSSTIFLFFFLPLVLAAHWLVGKHLRNSLLLLASLIFYSWGEGIYVLVMIGSIVCNYTFGLVLDTTSSTRKRKLLLAFMVGCNLLLLTYFKYLVFLLSNLNALLAFTGWQQPIPENIRLPIGISFFTFQAMSYLIDVYRGTSQPQRSILDVGLYISLFPQLIAGPIVRYHHIHEQLRSRVISAPLIASGIERFIFGLAKKVLIANQLGYFADRIFGFEQGQLGFATAWLGIICYTLQIYFDFSGYSDMAIGLGRMFGFKFLENFNFPYISKSIREFWRRWHISLSGWFRDYLYFPLGGSRVGKIKTGRNLIVVFFICGFWHGAQWNFLIWGLLHGFFLILERTSFGKRLQQLPSFLQHCYTMLIVLTTFVFFRSETLSFGFYYLSSMYSFPNSLLIHPQIAILLDTQFYLTLAIGVLLSMPFYNWIASLRASYPGLDHNNFFRLAADTSKLLLVTTLFLLSIMEISIGSYNPFIYFRF